jgi:hypothetical protein
MRIRTILAAAAVPAALAATLLGATAASAAVTGPTGPAGHGNSTITITSQGQLDNLVAQGGGVINKNIDIAAGATTTYQDGAIWLAYATVNGNVSIEGNVQMAAATVNGNVTVNGGSLWFANELDHITGNLTVTGSPGDPASAKGFGDNAPVSVPWWTPSWSPAGSSLIEGNLNYTGNHGQLYVGSPLQVNGNLNYSGNTTPWAPDLSGLTVLGHEYIS